MRKGQIVSEPIFKIILVILALGIIGYGVSSFFGGTIFFAKLIPGFNYTENTEGMSIIGINLAKGNEIEYYTGSKWNVIDTKSDKFILGDYEIEPNVLAKELQDFYLKTSRDPVNFNVEVNSWRFWGVHINSQSGLIEIIPQTKNGLSGPSSNPLFPSLNVGSISLLDKFNSNGFGDADFAKIDYEHNPSLIGDLIAWRDSILQGGKCQKLLTIEFKKNGIDESKSYFVRKNTPYIFIDLNEPISDSSSEKYSSGCFDLTSYENNPLKIENPISISFEEKGPSLFSSYSSSTIVFNPSQDKKWFYFFGLDPTNSANPSYPEYAVYSRLQGLSIYDGLKLLFDSNNGPFKKYSAKNIKISIGSEGIASFSSYSDLNDKVFYDLLTKYYGSNFANA